MPISADDMRPPFQQIADDLRDLIIEGVMPPGTRLPSTRELMERYEVATGTVQRAIRVLRSQGLVETAATRGTFVRADLDPSAIGPPSDDGDNSEQYRALMDLIGGLSADIGALASRVNEIERRLDEPEDH